MSSDVEDFRPATDIRLPELSDQLTVVTAYFYIAEYRKRGSSNTLSTRDLYRQVIIVVFTDLILGLCNTSTVSLIIQSPLFSFARPSARVRWFLISRSCECRLSIRNTYALHDCKCRLLRRYVIERAGITFCGNFRRLSRRYDVTVILLFV